MKKIIMTLSIAVIATLIFSSCAGSRNGMGCPSSVKSKPFRA